MADNHQIHKRFLEDQHRWIKERDDILEEIEIKLYKMRNIAEYAVEHELSSEESDRLNDRLDELKIEIHLLGEKLQVVVH